MNAECKLIYGSVLMVLLVMAVLRVNLGPPVEQNKTNQVLTLGPYHGKKCTWLTHYMLRRHTQAQTASWDLRFIT